MYIVLYAITILEFVYSVIYTSSPLIVNGFIIVSIHCIQS